MLRNSLTKNVHKSAAQAFKKCRTTNPSRTHLNRLNEPKKLHLSNVQASAHPKCIANFFLANTQIEKIGKERSGSLQNEAFKY
jgi:hypothetical protein